jgi:hypothetical protein
MRTEKALAMKTKVVLLTLLIAFTCLILSVGLAYGASVSATLNIQQGGSDVVEASKGSTVTLHCIYTITPPSSGTGTGTIYYKYSITSFDADDDAVMASLPNVPVTTLSSWAPGSERTVDFTIPDAGYYVFFLEANKGASGARTFYPASGTFYSNPGSVLPESPPIAGLTIGFAALGLFVVVTKRRTKQP